MFASGKTAAVASAANYIEEVFSTYLYTGNTTAQTITNGIDLAGKGGMVWIKSRTSAAGHALWDTARTPYYYLVSNATSAEQSVGSSNALTAYNADGFTVTGGSNAWNGSQNYTSWTFRKQPKFFDVVTFTATSSNDQRISHLLGSVPGCIMLKGVDVSSDWFVYHRSVNAPDARQYVTYLNSTVASQFGYGGDIWGASDPTSTDFGFKSGVHLTAGKQYVAYLFAHDAGGFGLTGTDNVISCGSYTGTGSDMSVTLGYEPQYVMIKRTDSTGDWWIGDTMRGFNLSGVARLEANTSDAEAAIYNGVQPTSTGFFLPSGTALNGGGDTFIYIAIRRGPMKVPTSGTSVFLPSTAPATTPFDVGFPPDLALWSVRDSTGNKEASSRLQGGSELFTNTTAAEASGYDIGWASKTNFWYQNVTGGSMINWMFRRAPSFFDVVCYTGTGSATTVTHNLAVVPEMMIVKDRSQAGNWTVYNSSLGNTKYLRLNSTIDAITDPVWNNTTPTTTVFSVGSGQPTNGSGATYVAYLFATCAGVSKVFNYTGNGSSQTINCGFTGGARWILIKRTDSTGDWYVWDSARGIVSGNDPHLSLNTTAAEVTTDDTIDTDSTGFVVNQVSATNVNVSSATYIGIAIA